MFSHAPCRHAPVAEMYEGPSGSGGTRRSIIAWATCFGIPALSAAEASGARTSLQCWVPTAGSRPLPVARRHVLGE